MNQTGLPVKPGNFSPAIFPKAGKFGRLSPLLSISTKYLSGFQLRHGCCNSQKPRLVFIQTPAGIFGMAAIAAFLKKAVYVL